VAGENAVGGIRVYQGSLGTQVVKVFDLAVARTGLRDSEARKAGMASLTTCGEHYDHKAYYPGARKLSIAVTGEAGTGRLVGAQMSVTGNPKWPRESMCPHPPFITA
jgi:NADPH-dependent 2,4-dienoyl-CoA reductase/sulfur reductase-like enzyme